MKLLQQKQKPQASPHVPDVKMQRVTRTEKPKFVALNKYSLREKGKLEEASSSYTHRPMSS